MDAAVVLAIVFWNIFIVEADWLSCPAVQFVDDRTWLSASSRRFERQTWPLTFERTDKEMKMKRTCTDPCLSL